MRAAPHSPASPASASLIAVVDDDQSVRHAVGNLLNSVGYSSCGYESAEAFLATPPMAQLGCLVLDVKLKGMDGFALQQRLTADAGTLPIIFISGHGDAAMERRALAAGAVAFLRKPIDVDALLRHIQHALAAPERDA